MSLLYEAQIRKFDIELEALLEVLCNLRLCRTLSMPLTLMYFLLSDYAFDSMNSQEDFMRSGICVDMQSS